MNTRDDQKRTSEPMSPGAGIELGATVYDVAKDLRRDVAEVRFPLSVDGAVDAAESRDRLVTQLDEHLLPRMKKLSSPAVVVVSGSTGAGKSTLYNSILGEDVSPAGVLRPTTRQPVLAYNPADEDVLDHSPATAEARIIQRESVPRGIALVDAPDLDSLLAENRDTAKLLLEAADLWLFVTTAARYGDALPWRTLTGATERGASVAMVLNRVPRETLATIRADLLARLREHGMEATPLFVIPDLGPHEGLLDSADVAPIARWLAMLAGPDRSRSVIVRTLKGSLSALPKWVNSLADSVDRQVEAAQRLRARLYQTTLEVTDAARQSVASGATGHGAIAALWARLSAERVVRVTIRKGVARSSGRRARAREAALAQLATEARSAAEASLVAAARTAFEAFDDAVRGADAPPGGDSLVPDAADAAEQRARRASEGVARWSAHVDAAVDSLSATGDVRAAGAIEAFGRSGVIALVMAAAVGSRAAQQRVVSVMGDPSSAMITALRNELADVTADMVGHEAEAFRTPLDQPALADDAGAGLRVRLAELRRLM